MKSLLLPKRPVKAVSRALQTVVSPTRPVLVQLVVTRRCNLTCGYCNEYDETSPPVDIALLEERVDCLARLGTMMITLTGGEPFLHPALDKIVARVVDHGILCTSISNAYPITERWIDRMNRAGLSLLQVSVDNVEPNEVSQKSWSKIKQKLLLLKEHADFQVNVNAVLGSSGVEQTRQTIDEIRALGFLMTVGLLHDERGQIDAGLIGEDLPSFYRDARKLCRKHPFQKLGEGWEDEMLAHGLSEWKCRAGSRYLYIDEHGMVAYCSQRRQEPGIPLLSYTKAHMQEAFDTRKSCAPSCTIAGVRRASSLDEWRPQANAERDGGALLGQMASLKDGNRLHVLS